MKKALNWIKRILIAWLITIAISPFLLYGFLFLCVKGLEWERDALNAPAEHALQELGVSDNADSATWYDLTIDGVMTVFEIAPLALDGTDGWSRTPVTATEYTHRLEALAPEAAFLLPASDIVFDLYRSSSPNQATWYDADTELLIHFHLQDPPTPGVMNLDTFSVPHNGWMYELETHSGFFGDGATYRAFIVPEAERPALGATLSSHADWHSGLITYEEYVTLYDRHFYAFPPLYPSSDITFDWWCYVDTFARANPDFESQYVPDNSNFPAVMREAGARPAGNWLAALYDSDTGLFIFYQYDS